MHDIIGDIHGQAGKLVHLLRQLGYRERNGAWRHPERTVLFVGDFIDRGPGQQETLWIARRMVEAGSAEAVLGNHEFNAIAWATPDPIHDGEFLRRHTEKNRAQHAAFLAEVGDGSPLHQGWIDWFMQLPLWLEKPGLRLVHACWHPGHMQTLSPWMNEGARLTPRLVELASRKGHPAFRALETLCKGPEIDLPPPVTFTDAQGIVRDKTRIRWWDEGATTYRTAAMVGAREAAQLPETPIDASIRVSYDNKKPLFFGHYWFTGTPAILSPRACCVDYSAAKGSHPLVAYRWEGEQDLTSEHLVGTTLSARPGRPPAP